MFREGGMGNKISILGVDWEINEEDSGLTESAVAQKEGLTGAPHRTCVPLLSFRATEWLWPVGQASFEAPCV